MKIHLWFESLTAPKHWTILGGDSLDMRSSDEHGDREQVPTVSIHTKRHWLFGYVTDVHVTVRSSGIRASKLHQSEWLQKA